MTSTYTRLVDVIQVRARMARLGLSQERFARILGIHPSLLTRYFRGDRPPPPGFFEKVNAALDRLEAAKKAADAEYERVLSGASSETKSA